MITPYGKHTIRKSLYDLKKTWGVAVEWYRLLDSTMNVETGKMVTTWEKYTIRRGILLPSQLERKPNYSLSFLAANKNFIYGADFDVDTRFLLIDVRDLPKSMQIDPDQPEFNDKLIVEHKRYQLKKVEDYDHSLAWLLQIVHIKNSEAEDNVLTVRASNQLRLADETVSS